MVVSHKIFLARLFAPPNLLRPGATAPLCPPSVTPLGLVRVSRVVTVSRVSVMVSFRVSSTD